MDMEKVSIPWRESNRKDSTEYTELPANVARIDYSIPMANVNSDVVVELLTRAVAHIYNNEAISACIRNKAKSDKEGGDFDRVTYLHNYRMLARGKILDGSFGKSRGVAVAVVTDPITAKMQEEMHLRLLKIATRKGRTDFPDEFNGNTMKIVILPKSGKTLGQLVAEMIAADDGTVRQKAVEAVAREKAERQAALAAMADTGDEDSLLEDEMEEETPAAAE